MSWSISIFWDWLLFFIPYLKKKYFIHDLENTRTKKNILLNL